MLTKTPSTLKKQGYNDVADGSMGCSNGRKSQSMKDRRDESEGEDSQRKAQVLR